MRQEQGLAFAAADARVVEIDMDHRLAAGLAVQRLLLQRDREGAARLDRRNVARLPGMPVEKQIFVAVEAEQRDRLEIAVRILAEEDRIFPLDLLIFGREDQHLVDAVAMLRAVPREQAQVVVIDVVQQDLIGHFRL
jgi:hypothetical protein